VVRSSEDPIRTGVLDGAVAFSLGVHVDFELAGPFPATGKDRGGFRLTAPGMDGIQRRTLRIHARPFSRPDPRLLDPFHISPMEWRLENSLLSIRGRSFAADIDLESKGDLEIALWYLGEDREAFHGSVSNLLRIVLAIGRLSPCTLLVHSSSIVVNGRVALLFGKSGAGKTTFGRLSREAGYTVASDDLNLLEILPKQSVLLQGFPFSGDYGPRTWAPAPLYPLAAIFRLEKSEKNEVVPLAKADAVAGLASCAAFMNGEPALMDELLGLLQDLVFRVPLYTLRFRKDHACLPLVEEVLRA
jgi:hypothetical protein